MHILAPFTGNRTTCAASLIQHRRNSTANELKVWYLPFSLFTRKISPLVQDNDSRNLFYLENDLLSKNWLATLKTMHRDYKFVRRNPLCSRPGKKTVWFLFIKHRLKNTQREEVCFIDSSSFSWWIISLKLKFYTCYTFSLWIFLGLRRGQFFNFHFTSLFSSDKWQRESTRR